MQLGRVYDAACQIALERDPGVAGDVVIPVVAECDDSFLNDCRRMQVERRDVRAAYEAALASRASTAPPDEGAVGAGHGDVLPGLQGRHRYVLAGHPRGTHRRGAADDQLRRPRAAHRRRRPGRRGCSPPASPDDAGWLVHRRRRHRRPGDGSGCDRLARRVGLGLARTGSVGAPRQRRDLPGRQHHARPDRDGTGSDAGTRWPARRSTPCSRRWSTPPRRPCSTRCSSRRRPWAATATPARGSTRTPSPGCCGSTSCRD